MTIESLQFFHSPERQLLLKQYADLTQKELEDLALKLSKKDIPYKAELITLLKLRQKAKEKFSKYQNMFFTGDGLEQANHENISIYITNRFKKILSPHSQIMDLTCGIGGNTIFFAKYFNVKAIDMDEIHLQCAKYNAQVYGVEKNIEFILGKSEENIQKSDAFFIDPQRIRKGKTKTRSLLNSSPDIFTILPELLKITSNICIKISPAFDYLELQKISLDYEIELISQKNSNKAALLWFGDFKTCERKATILTENSFISFMNSSSIQKIAVISQPLTYLYEPNNALTKSRLIDEFAATYKLKKINEQTAFLTSDQYLDNISDICRIFQVLDIQPFSLKSLKKHLRDKEIQKAQIVTRRFPQNAQEMRTLLKLKEGSDYIIILTVLSDEKHYAIITKRMGK